MTVKVLVLHLSSPKRYVSILKREKLLEVSVAVEEIHQGVDKCVDVE
ncbi:10510_t:CDS:2, partial [Funneliformis caledonium]